MRFAPDTTRQAAGRLTALMGCGTLALALLTGCDSKGFIDPGEVGRYKHTTLTLPILNQIDSGIEERRPEFTMAVEPSAEDLVPTSGDYRLNPNDQLAIEVLDLAVGSQTKFSRISESGNITLPYLPDDIHAAGLTESELQKAITEAYRRAQILRSAQVSVTLVEARGRSFSILGAVNQPSQYLILKSDFRVLDALTLARDTTSPLIEDMWIIRSPKWSRAGAPSQPATGPGGGAAMPAMPATRPTAPDDLAPRTQADPAAMAVRQANATQNKALLPGRVGRPVLLAVDAGDVAPSSARPAPAAVPATAPAGQFITVGGKPFYIGPATQPAAAAPAPAALSGTGMAGGSAAGNMAAGSAAGGAGTASTGFEGFRDVQADAQRIIHVPLIRLKNGELQFNVVIRPEDTIIVQQLPIGEYYMGGHVGRTGAYTLSQRKITLKQAVISANMFDQLAIPERTEVIRRIGPDKEVFVRVNLAKIFAGEQSDIFLKPDDQVMVGTNALAPFLAAARGAFRLTYGFGFLYDRNFAANENNRTN